MAHQSELIAEDIHAYLKSQEEKGLLSAGYSMQASGRLGEAETGASTSSSTRRCRPTARGYATQ